MNTPGEGAPPGSYWNRFVPISTALVAFGSVLLLLPLVGQIVVPAALLVQLWNRQEEPAQRYLPMVAAAALVSVLAPPFGIFAAAAALSGILLDQGVRGGWDWRTVASAAAVPLFLVIAISLLSAGSDAVRQRLDEFMRPFMSTSGTMGTNPEQFKEVFEWLLDVYVRVLPGLILTAALFYSVFALLAGTWWLRRQGASPAVEVPQLAMWALPDVLAWPTAAGLALAVWSQGLIQTIGLNLVVVLAVLYSIQGLAIVWYGFIVRAIPGWARALVIVAMFIFPPAIIPVVIVGILETWVPFRSLMAAGAGNGDEEES